MKFFLGIIIVFFSMNVNAQNCNYMRDIQREYDVAEAKNAVGRQLVEFVLGRVLPKTLGLFADVLSPSSMGTPLEAYVNNIKRIRDMLRNGDSKSALQEELRKLKINAQGIRIERIWGDAKLCYDTLDDYTKFMERVIDNR